MFRKIVRVLAILFLLGSIGLGIRATSAWLTPSDEQQTYDKKFLEAKEKMQKAEAARGTEAAGRLAQEAKEAVASVEIWRRALSERMWWNRLGVIVNSGIAGFSLIILLLTFIRRKPPIAVAQPNAWSPPNQSPNYGRPSNFDNPHSPRQ